MVKYRNDSGFTFLLDVYTYLILNVNKLVDRKCTCDECNLFTDYSSIREREEKLHLWLLTFLINLVVLHQCGAFGSSKFAISILFHKGSGISPGEGEWAAPVPQTNHRKNTILYTIDNIDEAATICVKSSLGWPDKNTPSQN